MTNTTAGRPAGAAAKDPHLLEAFMEHRGALYDTLKAALRTGWGVEPARVDAASLEPIRFGPITPGAGHVRRFIEATRGVPADFERDGRLLLPPTYASTWSMRLMCRALVEARIKLPMPRVLHAGNMVAFHRWPAAGEELHLSARLASIDATETRTIIVGRIDHSSPAGDELFTVSMTLFFPGPARGKKGGSGERKKKEVARVPFGATEIGRLRPSLEEIRTYTAVSGDFNPVHISNTAARAAGFPRAFMHGYATKAIAANAVIHEALGGDPTRLRSVDVRFTKLLLAGLDVGIYLGAVRVDGGRKVRTLDVGPGPGEASIVTGTVTTA